jgi:hypothetical protein
MNKALYNKFIVLLTSRLLQTNNLPLKFEINHNDPCLIQILLFYKSLRSKENLTANLQCVSNP